jgi:hypothetical protein
MDDVIDHHLEKIMTQSDVYKSVKVASKKRKDLEIIRDNANQMTDFLKGKAA